MKLGMNHIPLGSCDAIHLTLFLFPTAMRDGCKKPKRSEWEHFEVIETTPDGRQPLKLKCLHCNWKCSAHGTRLALHFHKKHAADLAVKSEPQDQPVEEEEGPPLAPVTHSQPSMEGFTERPMAMSRRHLADMRLAVFQVHFLMAACCICLPFLCFAAQVWTIPDSGDLPRDASLLRSAEWLIQSTMPGHAAETGPSHCATITHRCQPKTQRCQTGMPCCRLLG